MPILNVTHDDLRKRIYGLAFLNEKQRKGIFDIIVKLNGSNDWYPEHFRKALKALHEQDLLSDFERKAVWKEFFSDMPW
jgi:hypothetical protein